MKAALYEKEGDFEELIFPSKAVLASAIVSHLFGKLKAEEMFDFLFDRDDLNEIADVLFARNPDFIEVREILDKHPESFQRYKEVVIGDALAEGNRRIKLIETERDMFLNKVRSIMVNGSPANLAMD